MKKRDFRQVVLVSQPVRAKDLKSFFCLFQWEKQGGIALEILQWFESTSERLFFFGMPLRGLDYDWNIIIHLALFHICRCRRIEVGCMVRAFAMSISQG